MPIRALLLQRAEIERQRDAAQELYLIPGANKARVRVSLASFAEQLESLDEQLTEARGAGSAAIKAIAASLADVEGADRTLTTLGARFNEAWAQMPLEDQRALVRALLEVKIHPASIARKMGIERRPDGSAEVVVLREGPQRISIRRL